MRHADTARPGDLAGAAADTGARARALPWREAAIVLGFYGLLTVIISWPLAAHFGSSIPGTGTAGDSSGYVWDLWYHAEHGLRLWGTDVQEAISAPFGRVSPAAVNSTLLVTLGPGWLLATATSPIVAYNVLVLSGLALSGASMYLLIRWLGLGIAASIWAGVAFMIFPYEQLRAVAHLPLVHIWCLPLLLLAGFRWLERPGGRRALWLILALGLCWVTNPYYGAMGLVIAAVIGIVGGIRTVRAGGVRAGALRLGELAGLALVLVAAPLAILQSSSQSAIDTTLARDPVELEIYGARVTDYLLPDAASPFFGGLVGADTWASLGSPGGERTAFVGWATLLLALFGAAIAVRRWGTLSQRVRIALVASAPLIAVLVLVSLASPTRILGVEVTMPSSLLFDALPYLRGFARFSAAVMAVLLVVAAFGLAGLMRGRTPLFRACVLSLALIASAMELPIGSPEPRVIPSAEPLTVNGASADRVPTWAWLRDNRPGEIVYEQPGFPNETVERYYMYGQLIHGHRITNGSLAPGQIGYDFMRANGDVRWPGMPDRLAALGVGLVTINPWAYALAQIPPPDPAAPPAGFEVVRLNRGRQRRLARRCAAG